MQTNDSSKSPTCRCPVPGGSKKEGACALFVCLCIILVSVLTSSYAHDRVLTSHTNGHGACTKNCNVRHIHGNGFMYVGVISLATTIRGPPGSPFSVQLGVRAAEG